MAKVRDQADNLTGSARDATPRANGAVGTWTSRLGQAVGQVFGPRRPVVDVSTLNGKRTTSAGTNGAKPTTATNQTAEPKRSPWDPRPKSQMGKLVFGMLIYFLGSQLLEFGLAAVFNWLRVSVTARQTLFPPNTWVVGGLSNFSLIYFLLIALFVWALFRFNIIPRDFLRPANQRSGTVRGAQGTKTNSANGAGAGTSANGSSAARHSGRQRLTMTTPSTKAKRPASRTAGAKAPATAAKAVASRTNGKAPAPPSADESYERVKSLQRTRRRKH